MRIAIQPKFKFLDKYFTKDGSFTLLDVGSGNHSAIHTKQLFPNSIYHGLDREKSYNNTESDFEAMDRFFELDLTELKFDEIPDNFYDAIILNHVIEHLYNGTEVITALTGKLKPGGYMYIEYPGMKSTRTPSMEGTLNFFDDDTHVRIYSQIELFNCFIKAGCIPIRGGIRRDWFNV